MIQIQLREPYVPQIVRMAPSSARVVVGAVDVPSVPGAEAKPLRPTPNVITATNLGEYIDILAPLIDSLNTDVHSYIPTGDAAQLNAEAIVLDYEAKKLKGVEPDYAAELRARAAAKRKLAMLAPADPEILVKNNAFIAEWESFYARWLKEYDYVRGLQKEIPFALTKGSDWTALQGYDLEYQRFSARYEASGFPLTMKVPPSAPDISGIPWGWIIFGIIVVGVAVVLGQLRGLLPPAR